MNGSLRTYWPALLLLLCLAAANPVGAAPRGVPASEGIANFGKVSDHLYRGAQPDSQGIRNLKKLGIRTILNLCQTNEVSKTEAAEAHADGLIYVSVPMRGMGRPTAEQIAKALAAIDSSPGPVFVHCRHGCERTGAVIACYRIQHYQWPNEAALQEAKHYAISWFARGMRSCIMAFGKPQPGVNPIAAPGERPAAVASQNDSAPAALALPVGAALP